MQEVVKERTGWRDETMSRFHRTLGILCGCTDIDFMMIEYRMDEGKLENQKLCALIEYKNFRAGNFVVAHHPPMQALGKLATNSNIPAFFIQYSSDVQTFRIEAINDYAQKFLRKNVVENIDRKRFAHFMYLLRGVAEVPDEVLKNVLAFQA